jgi:hypothetical protein
MNMRGRTKSDTIPPSKKYYVKELRTYSDPIEIGNGYGYFCTIDNIEKNEKPRSTNININVEEEEAELTRKQAELITKKMSTICCGCIPFLLCILQL